MCLRRTGRRLENTFQREVRLVGGHYFQGHYWQVEGCFPFARDIIAAREATLLDSKTDDKQKPTPPSLSPEAREEMEKVNMAAQGAAAARKAAEQDGAIYAASSNELRRLEFKRMLAANDRPPMGQLFFILSNPDQYIKMLRSFDHDVVFEEMNRFLTGYHETFRELPESVVLRATTAELVGAARLPKALPGDETGHMPALDGPRKKKVKQLGAGGQKKISSGSLLYKSSVSQGKSQRLPPIIGVQEQPPKADSPEPHHQKEQPTVEAEGEGEPMSVEGGKAQSSFKSTATASPPTQGEKQVGHQEPPSEKENNTTTTCTVPGTNEAKTSAVEQQSHEEEAKEAPPPLEEAEEEDTDPLDESSWLSDVTVKPINLILLRWWEEGGSDFANNEEIIREIGAAIVKDTISGRLSVHSAHVLLQELAGAAILDANLLAMARKDGASTLLTKQHEIMLPPLAGLIMCYRAAIAATIETNLLEACEFLLDAKTRYNWSPTHHDYNALLKLLPSASESEKQAFSDCIRALEGVGPDGKGRKQFPFACKARFMSRVVVPFLRTEFEKLAKKFWRFWVLWAVVFAAMVYTVWWYELGGGKAKIDWTMYAQRTLTDEELDMDRKTRYEHRKQTAVDLGNFVLSKRIAQLQQEEPEEEQSADSPPETHASRGAPLSATPTNKSGQTSAAKGDGDAKEDDDSELARRSSAGVMSEQQIDELVRSSQARRAPARPRIVVSPGIDYQE